MTHGRKPLSTSASWTSAATWKSRYPAPESQLAISARAAPAPGGAERCGGVGAGVAGQAAYAGCDGGGAAVSITEHPDIGRAAIIASAIRAPLRSPHMPTKLKQTARVGNRRHFD